jgi:hypothetical protein
VNRDQQDHVYPLTNLDQAADKFTNALIFDVAEVLVAHGYPQPAHADLVKLAHAIYGFLYGEQR